MDGNGYWVEHEQISFLKVNELSLRTAVFLLYIMLQSSSNFHECECYRFH